jgi:hypothetical protein
MSDAADVCTHRRHRHDMSAIEKRFTSGGCGFRLLDLLPDILADQTGK